ncbi:hypothetical protein C9424_20680 [Arthrobacter sp. H-02-3]|nr:hypothetical protein C9424_20680 [Arthrobacter sp. H-02-3]
MAIFYFSSVGNPVAFRRTENDRFLFDKTGNWIGWFPWGDSDAVDKDGNYLGTTVGNRLLKRDFHHYRGYPGFPGFPGFAGYPGYPGFAGFGGHQAGYSDVPDSRLKG